MTAAIVGVVVVAAAAVVGTQRKADGYPDAVVHSHVEPALAPATEVVTVQDSASAAGFVAVGGFEHTVPVAQLVVGCTSVAPEADCTVAGEAVRVAQAARSEPELEEVAAAVATHESEVGVAAAVRKVGVAKTNQPDHAVVVEVAVAAAPIVHPDIHAHRSWSPPSARCM